MEQGFHLHKARKGKEPYHFWFHVESKNGRILVTSEMYTSRFKAVNGILALFFAVVGYKTTLDSLHFHDHTKKKK